ncbi:DUF4920 domain-containing protein [Crocinitomix sp.]|nr:DUF4920 domain-containing protein [Crocinitomix sp.]
MKKNLYLGLLSVGFLAFASCGGTESNEETTADVDTTEVVTEEEEVSELAFDGVEKGDYMLYGHSEIEPTAASVTVEEMNGKIAESGAFEGMVKVNVDEVCQKAGCWITFNNGEAKSIRVFFRDHFTIPIGTPSGTEAILYGKAVVDTLSMDFQKHLLDDAAEKGDVVAQEEYDAITEDLIETTFDCESILVKK